MFGSKGMNRSGIEASFAKGMLHRSMIDATNSTGNSVASLTTSVTDADVGAKRGIAVIGVTGTSSGAWHYTLNGGTTWIALSATSITAALLLPSNGSLTKLRYVLNLNFVGTVSISYRAWDQTSGTAGSFANVATASLVGGNTAFSAAIETACLTVGPLFASLD